ncbi:hypothetical protein BMH32_04930 [Leucobacter sp. OLJS4]|uniref:glucose-6-phosphate dehydrogenase assembly protein OpcA n=1 Tax=unclassified Leucobacter TaxID=2621730 RepID=UPI000C1866D4|nr:MULTISPECIES: glucose-6-phosphate dehydrogenase assembly protein OpcA [unclassified Leucobacter]PIJ09572.1 hypothetical protein BMH30_13885 [Leucobacter sp. OLES1]PII81522.1 hypothetical protein BMH25_13390 [Leucobacter sp. OLCALW19]PII86194.1 hypothetical protein BMH26_13810 [Leucobacter sp. OLTLW20]PII90089.1 hypothetical protein BMH27_11975 [Leucobacter sp. OLAS13]PII97122.1 hypothetical protein BMH29_12660 [Leucobacter sp. OLDS2]
MIETLPDTTVSGISKRLVLLRAEGGATTLSRVLTLLIFSTSEGLEDAVAAANFASREHPMRIIAITLPEGEDRPTWVGEVSRDARQRELGIGDVPVSGLDAEIRVGRDAGAGEVIVLRPRGAVAVDPERLVSGLLLADAPVVVWWSDVWPSRTIDTPLGRLAQRRISDSGGFRDPAAHLTELASGYRAGDTDLAWSRVTLWRAQLAAALDNAPERRITGATVCGTPDSSSTMLLGAWLRLQLGVPVRLLDLPESAGIEWGIQSVTIHSDDADTVIERSRGTFAAITQPGHPRLEVPIPRRGRAQCLVEDLRLLQADQLFGRVLTAGVPLLLADQPEGER